jgi:pyrimidine deaminase RibD-like protein
MNYKEVKFMEKAVELAKNCKPANSGIPRVGAVVVAHGNIIAEGHRGTGRDEDDRHAEEAAILSVDPSSLAGATLYTTLEPCTREVRSKPLECCTELIHRHRIKKVFIGILDPNQGVTGKGLWYLQTNGVEVDLFPHELSEQIRAQNLAFIRSQEMLGATIVTPKDGDEIRTIKDETKVPVQFKCVKEPGPDTYLFVYRGGRQWPQGGPLRKIKSDTWEINAHLGGTGDFTLQLVTVDSLGAALIRFYRQVVESNLKRREELLGIVDEALLRGNYPGIEMSGPTKGIRVEASVDVTIAYNVNLISTSVESTEVGRGRTLKIYYEVECPRDIPEGIWLGASFTHNQKLFHSSRQDKPVALKAGRQKLFREFTIPEDAPVGKHMLRTSLWRGTTGVPERSKYIAGAAPLQITIL